MEQIKIKSKPVTLCFSSRYYRYTNELNDYKFWHPEATSEDIENKSKELAEKWKV